MSTTKSMSPGLRLCGTGTIVLVFALALMAGIGTASAQSEFLPQFPPHYSESWSATVDVYPGMPPYSLSASVSGEAPCSDVTGRYCPGYVSGDSMHLRVFHSTLVEIEVTWATVDTVLALTGPTGVFSDDDGGRGTQSRLSVHLVPGDYSLFLGTYSWRDWGQVRLEVHAAAPAMVVYPTPPPRVIHYPTPAPTFPPIPPRPPVHVERRPHHPPAPPVHVIHRATPERPRGDRRHDSTSSHSSDRGRHDGRPSDRRHGPEDDRDNDRGRSRDRDDDRDSSRGQGQGRGRNRGRGGDRDSEDFEPTVRDQGSRRQR